MNISTVGFTIAALAGLFTFGIAYNRFVAGLETKGHDRGYMAFIVSAGVFVTLLVSSIIIGALTTPQIGILSWIIQLASFIASGLPMIWGSVTRHTHQRQQADQTAQDLLNELPDWMQHMHSGEEKDDGQTTQDRRVHIPPGA